MTRAAAAPLLGEWACLGALYDEPAHGWAVAARLQPEGDVGRVWTLSRPLTYRALALLTDRGWIRAVGEERGEGGPNRTILAATRSGRARLRGWVRTPVPHLRDLRGELLLKITFALQHGIDITDMLDRQRAIVDEHEVALAGAASGDHVILWRLEATRAARRFLDHVT